MKKLITAMLFVAACQATDNASVRFIKFLGSNADCQEMSAYTSVCKVAFPTKENPEAKALFYCHASPGTKPDCEAYEKAKPAVPAEQPTPFGK